MSQSLQFKNALVSCSDKTGLIELLKPLAEQGLRVVSTGGTAKYLTDNGIKVVQVTEQTGFPEVMDGRVKTLHPKVHMALLARKQDDELLRSHGLEPFDLVIGNLYPFEAGPDIENIDIGGPSLLRAAAKNHERITVICDPREYVEVSRLAAAGEAPSLSQRRRWAAQVFAHVSAYDAMIADWLGREPQFNDFSVGAAYVDQLRYGENPQQKAVWYKLKGKNRYGLHQARVLQGKALSYNNLLDLDAAVRTVREFTSAACVAVKHNNPCGVAERDSISAAVQGALASDPVSVFGGIIACNQELDESSARALSEIFLECIVAPSFAPAAREILAKKKNLRLLEWPQLLENSTEVQYRSVLGGLLVQDGDKVDNDFAPNWTIVGEEPSPEVKRDLLFAWKVVAHLKSNAIAIAGDGQTLGLGMGQVNRVDAVEHAIARMRKFHGDRTKAVLASDAFFPFPDSIEKISSAGIRWVIQPGGSVNDESVLAKARECGVSLVLTGKRHFTH